MNEPTRPHVLAIHNELAAEQSPCRTPAQIAARCDELGVELQHIGVRLRETKSGLEKWRERFAEIARTTPTEAEHDVEDWRTQDAMEGRR